MKAIVNLETTCYNIKNRVSQAENNKEIIARYKLKRVEKLIQFKNN